jgi:5-methylcytosine-specific restriction endonuclease McrA
VCPSGGLITVADDAPGSLSAAVYATLAAARTDADLRGRAARVARVTMAAWAALPAAYDAAAARQALDGVVRRLPEPPTAAECRPPTAVEVALWAHLLAGALDRVASPRYRRLTRKERELLRFAHGGRCLYCRARLDKEFHADHYVPRSRGGADTLDNYVAACPRCDAQKGQRLPWEWQPQRAGAWERRRRRALGRLQQAQRCDGPEFGR